MVTEDNSLFASLLSFDRSSMMATHWNVPSIIIITTQNEHGTKQLGSFHRRSWRHQLIALNYLYSDFLQSLAANPYVQEDKWNYRKMPALHVTRVICGPKKCSSRFMCSRAALQQFMGNGTQLFTMQ